MEHRDMTQHTWLRSGTDDHSRAFLLWDVHTGALTKAIPLAGRLERVIFTPDGARLVVAGMSSANSMPTS